MAKARQRSVKDKMKLRNQEHNIRLRTLLTVGFSIVYLIFLLSTIVFWGYSLFMPLQGRTEEVKDMILTISGVFSGPIGLIIGYFFWGDRDEP